MIDKQAEQAPSVVVGASGTASVVLNGPPRGYIAINSIVIKVTGTVAIPVCTAYEGTSAALGRVLGTIRAGDAGTFRSDKDRLTAGQQITIVWVGATVGAVCSATMRGTEISR